jgi:hypothetical protein
MPESQAHGFKFQRIVEKEVFGLETEIPKAYTGIHDVPKAYNKLNPEENVSIKTTGSETICFADPLRLFDYSVEEKHTAIAIYYRQEDGLKIIKKVVQFSLDDKSALFGDVGRDEIQYICEEIKKVPIGIPMSELNAHRQRINAMTKELSVRCPIQFNSKIDSKKQRRLQCSLSKIPPSIVYSCIHAAVVCGISITDRILSGRRIRNCRV